MKGTMMKRRFLQQSLLLPVLFLCGAGLLRAEWTVEKNDQTGQWLILENGKPVLQYNYAILPLPEDFWDKVKSNEAYVRKYAVPRCDYIQPLFDLDGNPVTKDWSDDHPHHRGIYWAWPEVGYKGEFGDLHALQTIFARPTGKIETVRKNGQLRLTAENEWKWQDKEPIVNEQVTITVFPQDKNGRKINLDLRFEALADEVTLARRGTQSYGGLNIRMLPLADWKANVFHAKEDAAQNPAWVSASWKNPKSDGRTELTVLEKTTNPDYPGAFIQFPNLNWFQPTFPKSGTRYTLKKGEPLVLNYQLWIHNAADDDTAKKETWEKFQKEK
ncbi:MAG: PmoA family protein [Planctomycetaceae bacterium]|jgi:hypothetical protein|nr:PmoA family protein [Planctomycetaceae bacterium]